MIDRKKLRQKRNFRVRKKIFGTSERPRLVVFVSNKNFYAQIINDEKQETLVCYSSLNLTIKTGNNKKICIEIGKKIALLALKNKLKQLFLIVQDFYFMAKLNLLLNPFAKMV